MKDLPQAIAATDSLVDYKLNPSSSNAGDKKKGNERKKGKFEKDWRKDKHKKGEAPKQKGSDPPQFKGKSGCFLCFDPHRFRDYPK